MSITEQIAVLESEKQSILHDYDVRIQALRRSDAASHQPDEEAPPIYPGSRFRPVPNTGMPASEMILRDRG